VARRHGVAELVRTPVRQTRHRLRSIIVIIIVIDINNTKTVIMILLLLLLLIIIIIILLTCAGWNPVTCARLAMKPITPIGRPYSPSRHHHSHLK
jgi:hypothetical protein